MQGGVAATVAVEADERHAGGGQPDGKLVRVGVVGTCADDDRAGPAGSGVAEAHLQIATAGRNGELAWLAVEEQGAPGGLVGPRGRVRRVYGMW